MAAEGRRSGLAGLLRGSFPGAGDEGGGLLADDRVIDEGLDDPPPA